MRKPPHPDAIPELAKRIHYLVNLIGGQTALGSRVGLARQTIWEFATGRREPPPQARRLIATRFPCSIEWLESGRDDPPGPEVLLAIAPATLPHSPRNENPDPAMCYELTREPVILECVMARLQYAVRSHSGNAFEDVLGKALAKEVKAGRACPSIELLCKLATALEIRQAWLLAIDGREDKR